MSTTSSMSLRELLKFPNPVNDYAARCTAGLVVALTLCTLLTTGTLALWLNIILFVGFVLRILGGPRYSPFGRLSVHVLAPRVAPLPKLVPGPPKRFAQGIGVIFSATALILRLADLPGWSNGVLIALLVAALLESALGFCLGCWLFGHLQRWGVIPHSVCEECNNIWSRPEQQGAA